MTGMMAYVTDAATQRGPFPLCALLLHLDLEPENRAAVSVQDRETIDCIPTLLLKSISTGLLAHVIK